MKTNFFLWLSRGFGILSSLGIALLCVNILQRGESPWLIPSIIFGSAILLSVPAALLLVWGASLLKKLDQKFVPGIKISMWFAAAPLLVSALGMIVGFIVIFLSPPGMTGGTGR